MHREPNCTLETSKVATARHQHRDLKMKAVKQQTGQGVLQPG